MKKIYRYAALVCASAAVAISCVEENLEPIIPAVDGDAIVFGVRAGFEDSAPGTKTEYSGEDYEYDGKTFERIDWVVNDKIEIYSPQAENPLATAERPKSTHYVVTNVTADDESDNDGTNKGKDFAKLANVGKAGLRWNGTQPHDFYAMYPSSEMFRSETGTIPDNINKGVLMGLDKETNSKVMVYGIVSDVQQPTVVPDPNNSGSYIAKPDMNYAYMVAKTSVDPNTTNNVKLSFVPIVTAVEIELVNVATEAVTIREIQVASDEPIVGGFTADLSGWNTDTYPTCTNLTAATDATEEEKEIQVTTLVQSGNSYAGVTLAQNATLKFTVFLLPGSDIENLTVRVSSLGYSYISKELKNANIPANLKTRIRRLNLPGDAKEFESGGDNWMEQLEPESVIKSLSLPGTGGSFTSTANALFRQQDLTFDQQWTLGVRAFELSSDRGGNNSSSGNLGAQSILCNKVAVSGWTVARAIKEILNKVTSIKNADGKLTETAALILTYQPVGGNPNRDIDRYADALSTLLTAGSGDNRLTQAQIDNIIPYTTDLTIEKARGKLILICRPSQKDENNNGTWSSSLFDKTKVTAIDGCGTAKDRWGARGYKTTAINKYWTEGTEAYQNILGGTSYRWAGKNYSSTITTTERAFDISNSAEDSEVITQTNQQSSWRLGANDTREGYDTDISYVEEFLSGKDFNIFQNGSTYAENGQSITRPDSTDPTKLQFGFETNQDNTVCWFQEWARVVPQDTHASGTWTDPSNSSNTGSYNIYWFESYSEKVANVKTTFDMAIGNYNSSYIYINSLCGYYATLDANDDNGDGTDDRSSLVPSIPVPGNIYGGLWGGAGGDIKGLSKDINPTFYNYVVEKGLGTGNQVTGPTGIVLMDFVMKNDNSEEYNMTEDLIQAIITNNQKYATSGPTLDNTNKEEGSNNPVQPF